MAEILKQLMQVMQEKLQAGSTLERRSFYKLCILLARCLDDTIALKQSPHSPQELLQLVKQLQVCTQREDPEVLPAIATAMLSFKSGVCAGWFNQSEVDDLLKIADKILCSYKTGVSTVYFPDNSGIVQLTDVLLRWYPWLKLEKVLLCVEAEKGYQALVHDFHVLYEPQKVRLFTVRTNKLDTPDCLAPPANANFLLNGLPVDRRTCVGMERGPSVPPDCTRLIAFGGNLLQIVGDFQAHYTVIIGVATNVPFRMNKSNLLEAKPLDSHSDDDLTEGSSTVSLKCTISGKRITTPVKGRLCKHLQCFDFDNYFWINQRRPSWTCPYCSVLIPMSDICLDKLMAKVLTEVEDNVDHVTLDSGAWTKGKRDSQNVQSIDLTMDNNDDVEHREKSTYVPHQVHQPVNHLEAEDRKPDVDALRSNQIPQVMRMSIPAQQRPHLVIPTVQEVDPRLFHIHQQYTSGSLHHGSHTTTMTVPVRQQGARVLHLGHLSGTTRNTGPSTVPTRLGIDPAS